MSRYLVFTLAAICFFMADVQSRIIYVESGENGDGTSWSSPYGSLQTGLNNAVAGDVILVKEGTYKPSVPVNNPVFSIPLGVTIKGGYFGSGDDRDILNHQTILSGDINGDDTLEIHVNKSDNCSTVTKVGWSSGQVVLDGLFVRGGYNDTGYGGGLYVEANNVTVNDCFFSCNYAAGSGGAIYSYGTLEIYNTLGDTWPANFEANYSGGSGGAVGAGLLTMEGTSFWNNHANGSGGGLLVSCGSGSKITNCKIEACSAGYNGGAVFTDCSNAEFTNCLFGNCSAGVLGGGVYNGLAWSSYDRCRFTLCFATSGGGFCSDYGAPTLTNCQLDYCGATSYGGGIYVAYEDCSIVNCKLTDNYTDINRGAGIYVESEYATAAIVNSILWENYYEWSNQDYDDQVSGTSAITYSCVQNIPSTISSTNTDGYYAAENVIDKGSNAAVTTPLDLAGNVRIRDIVDIGPYEGGGVYNVLYVDPDVAASEYDGQSWATAFRYLQDALHVARVDGAKEIWVADGDCYPNQSHDGSLTTGQREDSFVLVKGTKMYGGFRGKDSSYPGESSIEDRQGGASTLSGDIDLSGDNDSYNVVTILNDPDGLLDGFTITGGKSDGTLANSNGAGAVLIDSKTTINKCLFTGNRSAGNGGSLWLAGSNPTIVDCRFTENVAEYGAAIFNCASNPEIIGCSFDGNNSVYGGAIYNFMHSNPTIQGCIFQQNVASGNSDSAGGAIASENASAPRILNTVFTENTASKGGALFGNYRSDMLIANVTCALNQATAGSGGLRFDSTTSSPSVYNSIFWYNQLNGDDSTTAAQIDPISAADVRYSCVRGINGINGNTNMAPSFQNLLTSDNIIIPSHASPESFYPLADSLCCIDTGLIALTPVRARWADIAYYERVADGNGDLLSQIDMGAYERGDTVVIPRSHACPFNGFGSPSRVEFDFTYSGLLNPSMGWQPLVLDCAALKTRFRVEDSKYGKQTLCGGFNNNVQSGRCAFVLDLPTDIGMTSDDYENANTTFCLYLKGLTENYQANYDIGTISIDGVEQLRITGEQLGVECQTGYHETFKDSIVLDPGQHLIEFSVNTVDSLHHVGSYFEFGFGLNEFPQEITGDLILSNQAEDQSLIYSSSIQSAPGSR